MLAKSEAIVHAETVRRLVPMAAATEATQHGFFTTGKKPPARRALQLK
ncbi:MAG: hypothetical protein ACR2MN_16600 [Acidimicrobiales bacterium]